MKWTLSKDRLMVYLVNIVMVVQSTERVNQASIPEDWLLFADSSTLTNLKLFFKLCTCIYREIEKKERVVVIKNVSNPY